MCVGCGGFLIRRAGCKFCVPLLTLPFNFTLPENLFSGMAMLVVSV